MTNHLSTQEFVNALDGALAPARQSHLDGCASCQAQVSELRALIEEATEGNDEADVPEPSPLFWDHFQARVLTAVQTEGQPGHRAWWTRLMDARTLVAVSATVVAVVVVAAMYVNRPVPAALVESAAVESGVVADASVPLDNDEWEFVASMMGDLEDDDIHEVLAPSRDAVDSAIETLTVAERDRFVKLLKGELSEGLE